MIRNVFGEGFTASAFGEECNDRESFGADLDIVAL